MSTPTDAPVITYHVLPCEACADIFVARETPDAVRRLMNLWADAFGKENGCLCSTCGDTVKSIRNLSHVVMVTAKDIVKPIVVVSLSGVCNNCKTMLQSENKIRKLLAINYEGELSKHLEQAVLKDHPQISKFFTSTLGDSCYVDAH
jgi:predicted amidophosphoribosyltransferase